MKTLAGVGPVALLGSFANSRLFGEFKITDLSEHAPSFARVGENKEESCSDGQNSSSASLLLRDCASLLKACASALRVKIVSAGFLFTEAVIILLASCVSTPLVTLGSFAVSVKCPYRHLSLYRQPLLEKRATGL